MAVVLILPLVALILFGWLGWTWWNRLRLLWRIDLFRQPFVLVRGGLFIWRRNYLLRRSLRNRSVRRDYFLRRRFLIWRNIVWHLRIAVRRQIVFRCGDGLLLNTGRLLRVRGFGGPAFDLFRNRNRCLPVGFANRHSGEPFAGRFFNNVHARTLIDHDALRSTIELPVFAFGRAGFRGFVEDERIVHDHIVGPDPLVKVPALNKDKV